MEQEQKWKQVKRYVVKIDRNTGVPEQVFGPTTPMDCGAFVEGYEGAWKEYNGGLPDGWAIYIDAVQILEVVL